MVRWCWINFQFQGSYNLDYSRQGPTALAVAVGGGGGGEGSCVSTFLHSSILSFLFLPVFGRRPDID